MKKVIDWILKNMFGFVLGAILFTVIGVVAATSISSAQVKYTGNSQSTVEGALNNLYTKANALVEPDAIDFATLTSNASGTMIASSKGVCITRNNKVSCFKANNWNVEKDHIQQVFSGCEVDSSFVYCSASDFLCDITSSGRVYCQIQDSSEYCVVNPDNSVTCNPTLEILPIDPSTFQTNSTKTIYASSKGICLKRNNKLNCFKINNWNEEKDHIQQVFSDISCNVSSYYVECDATDFNCRATDYGDVSCIDQSGPANCYADADDVYCN